MTVWELIVDNESVVGKLVTTLVVSAVAIVVGAALGRMSSRRVDDRYRKYYARKIAHYIVAVIALIGLGIVWRPFAGQLGLVLGLTAAGLAFAMQELIGALAGWFNIVSGSIFRVGDRVQLGGVRGDVIDVTPLRTKVMEIGSSVGDDTWVRGRQYTGRIVSISNKSTFTDPVFNYSTSFEFIWEEVTIPVAYRDDWHLAERIMTEEAVRVSSSKEAEQAIAAMLHRYPVARTEVEPRVFLRATDNYLELAARFVVPVRTARWVKDDLTRRVLERFAEAGIPVASTTEDVTVRHAADESTSGADGPG
jgi:small-conductance mechanosensitive channel